MGKGELFIVNRHNRKIVSKADIIGGAALALDDRVNMTVTNSTTNGDDAHMMEVRPSQTLEITADRIMQTVAQRESSVKLPPECDCRGIYMYNRGEKLSLTISFIQTLSYSYTAEYFYNNVFNSI